MQLAIQVCAMAAMAKEVVRTPAEVAEEALVLRDLAQSAVIVHGGKSANPAQVEQQSMEPLQVRINSPDHAAAMAASGL